MIETFDICYGILLFSGGAYLYYVIKAIMGLKENTQQESDSEKSLSVLIPFRNEGENIARLQGDIKAMRLPTHRFEFIWINDHSEDGALPSELEGHRLVNLPESQTGKKQALKSGLQVARHNHVLTLDADVRLQPRFFDKVLTCWRDADVLVMPVFLDGDNSFQRFQQAESTALLGLTMGLAGSSDPVMANGAAFGYTKGLKTSIAEKGSRYASGDDIFTLQAAKRQGLKITPVIDKGALVKSPAPESIGAFISQRVRWVSKSPAFTDFSTNVMGLSLLVMYLAILGGTIAASYDWHWVALGGFYLIKLLVEWSIMLKTARIFDLPTSAFSWLVLGFVHPIYVLLIPIISIFYSPQWKGRPIRRKSPSPS